MRYAIAPVVGIAIGFSLKATFFPPICSRRQTPRHVIRLFPAQLIG